MSEQTLKKIEKQNEVIISLLGRMAFTPDKIREIVVKKKQNPQGYVDGYNACDGNHNVNEIAHTVGVKHNTLSPILQEWEELGIIYEVDKPNGTFYKRLFPI
jgi:hypothetical protein